MQQQDLIIYAIATIILVGSWVVNILRKQAEEREQTGESSASTADGSSKRRLDELAARRREELRAQARERRGETITRPGAGEPANMTMAERIARARAKAQYEQRAQQMGQPGGGGAGGASQGQAPRRPAPVVVGQREEKGVATEMERARQRDLQRREAERRQRQEAERRARAERERLQRDQQIERRRAEQEADRRRSEAEASAARRRNQQSSASTRSPSRERRSAYTPTMSTGERRPLPFTQRSLREAVVLREVFDRPLAMRDPVADRVY